MASRCEKCKNKLKCSLQQKETWSRQDILNEIDLVFVDILNDELHQRLDDLRDRNKLPSESL